MIVERSEAFIKDQAEAGRPFFLYMALTQIHPPLGHHPDFDNVTGTGIYGDILAEVDFNVGRILDTLSSAGVEDNTIVILTGDNGTVPDGTGAAPTAPGAAVSPSTRAACAPSAWCDGRDTSSHASQMRSSLPSTGCRPWRTWLGSKNGSPLTGPSTG